MNAQIYVVGLAVSISCLLLRTIYRLYFHPLSKFPGPKLPAITHLYEFYYDVVKGGKFVWEIQRMHEQYGPIVRINPLELHIKDPYYHDSIYLTRRQEKDPYMARVFSAPHSAAATVDHDHHRYRRDLTTAFFSKRSVMSLESLVHDKVDKASLRFLNAYEQGTVISIDAVFAGLTADLVSHYTYGESMGVLDSKDMKNDFRDAIRSLGSICHLTRFFAIFHGLIDGAPALLEWIQPTSKGLLDTRRKVEKKAMHRLNETKGKNTKSTKTIFDYICDPAIPPEERSLARVKDEAFIFLLAGTESTARVLTTGAFWIYRDRSLLQKVRDELKPIMPEPTTRVPLTQLEKLPYLTALVNESLRLSHPVIIPFLLGHPVSQIIYFVHMDPNIFPDPERFNADRWIEASNNGVRLNRFLVPFSKGPRMCMGMNLAYSVLYQMFATMIRRFDVEIHNTTPESIRITRELVTGLPDTDTVIVHGLVTGILD
ncbi:cytochrome P450 [Aspergillus avenaceus]|uniref:Cytochrome P450 n=1 Tax=Aspergillus avenaceus TaxID=36643 RepID=A0A5N6U3T0_ASPAV|nr:cytochrome P450 [Aspergillus avenaceus]